MQVQKILQWSLFIISILTIVFIVTIFLHPFSREPLQGVSVGSVTLPTSQTMQNLIDSKVLNSIEASISEKKSSEELPKRLAIPTMNVDAGITYVGVTPQGDMEAPSVPSDAAWFKLGPRPGEVGSAVISGHYGWKNNTPALFDNLNILKKGDKVYVMDEKGATITFVVRESRIYGENQDASNVFDSSDGLAHLNLITCKGIWNKGKKSYSERLVVFTDRETK